MCEAIPLRKQHHNSTIYISVSKHHIACCTWKGSSIDIYSLDGEFKKSYGTYGSDVGQLNYPYICDEDDAGNILIADKKNNRLQVMTPQGRFCVVNLTPRMEGPIAAAFYQGSVYVASNDSGVIRKYSCS